MLIVDQAVDVVAQQVGHVLGVVAQRRHPQRDHVQMRHEIAAERVRRGAQFEVVLRRTDPAHIERQPLPAADAGVAVLLDGARKRALRFAVQVLQSVQVQRPAGRLIERAQLDAAVAFAAEQRRGGVRTQARGNHHEKRLRCSARSERMQVARVGLAAGAQFTEQQHRR